MPRKSNRSSSYGSDVIDTARDRPIAAAAAAAAAVGAGVFLWSRRNQISNQLSDLSNQIREWRQSFPGPDDTGGLVETGETIGARGGRSGRTTRTGMSETGGGNASLGARSGGGGTTGSVSGRGRARSTTPQATR